MRLALTVFCMMIFGFAFAQEAEKELAGFDPKVDLISEKYEAGPFLIYDCEDKHWVCVSEELSKECESKRNEDLKAKKLNVRCASITKYPVKKSCFQRALFLTGKNHGTRFCIGESWKEKEIKFE